MENTMSTLLNEQLAREVARVLNEQAEQERRVRQLLRAKKLARHAERTAARARIALARAI